MGGSQAETDLEFQHWLSVLARRAPLFVAVLLTVLLVGQIAAMLRSPSYEANAEVIVGPPAGGVVVDAAASTEPDLQSELKLAESDEVVTAAERNSGKDVTLGVTKDAIGDVLTFNASGGDPAQVAKAANSYAAAFVARRREQVGMEYDDVVAGLRIEISQLDERLSALDSQASPSRANRQSLLSQRHAFQDALERLRVASVVGGPSSAHILARATTPGPSNASLFPYMGYVLLAGLFVATGAVALREFRDQSVTGPQAAERLLGAPVLGSVVRPRRWLRAGNRQEARGNSSGAAGETGCVLLDAPRSWEAEQFRSLRATLAPTKSTNSLVLQVTSAATDDGAATVVANLAIALAQGVGDTLLLNLEARAALQSMDPPDGWPGLEGILDGEASLAESVWNAPGVHRLRVLRALNDNSDLLTHPGFGSTFEHIRASYSNVIVLVPPVFSSSAALNLAPLVDGTVLCVRLWSTQVPDLAKAHQSLSLVEAHLRGVVIT